MRKILIIEENRMFQKIYQNLLVGRGFEVHLAGNVEECEAKLKQITPDLVLVNPVIASGQGVDLMDRIHGPERGHSGIPMLVVSSKDEIELRETAMKLGAVEFLVKHLAPPKTVVKKIETILQHRPPAPKHALDPRALKVGDVLDNRYEVLAILGKGGQGAVFRAYDRRLEEEVAVKILILNPEIRQELMESFLREVKLSRKITHSHVVRIYDIGQSGGIHYITMEYVEGSDLNVYIFEHWPMGYAELVRIFVQVASAIKAAHELGIVHRDIKPQNILMTRKGAVKVGDFGIASVAGAMLKTTEELSVGTPDYMAPEVASNDGNDADHRVDIYSFGIMMYEAFVGVLPYEGSNLMEKIQRHMEGNPRKPSEFNPDFPFSIEKIILRSMARDVNERYQNMNEVLADLKNVEL